MWRNFIIIRIMTDPVIHPVICGGITTGHIKQSSTTSFFRQTDMSIKKEGGVLGTLPPFLLALCETRNRKEGSNLIKIFDRVHPQRLARITQLHLIDGSALLAGNRHQFGQPLLVGKPVTP